MRNRTFLMLAQVFDPKKHNISHYLASEKLDGVRVFWDGGVSRGLLAEEVPYANTTKDFRRLAAVKSTGLWSRYGKTIQAHPAWLDKLPAGVPLDGELFIDRGQFQKTVSITKGFTPIKSEWEKICLMAFDSPSYEQFSTEGRINEPHQELIVDSSVKVWLKERGAKSPLGPMPDFQQSYAYLTDLLSGGKGSAWPVKQHPITEWKSLYESVLESGGEGVMLRSKFSNWRASRSTELLKVKPSTSDICEIIGWRSGRATDRGSKLLGKIGSLVVRWDAKEFLLSGFNDLERGLLSDWEDWATENPDCTHPDGSGMKLFSLGQKIKFRYSELSLDGVPLKASYRRDGLQQERDER